MFKNRGDSLPICEVGDARRLGYKLRILVSLRVLMTKHHHFSRQSILYGALEEVIMKETLIKFLISGLISLQYVGCTSMHGTIS